MDEIKIVRDYKSWDIPQGANIKIVSPPTEDKKGDKKDK